MLLKRFIIIAFCIFIFNQIIFSQTNDIIKINKIYFEGIKTTNPNYLHVILPVKEGDIWNVEARVLLENKLKKMTNIVEAFQIIEESIDKNNINLRIVITEKGSFIVVPFVTYSNSQGLKPQIKFMNFNLGGYGKFMQGELQFYPTENIDGFLTYKDKAINNNENYSMSLTGEFKTSVINYYANDYNGYPRGIAPIGVIGGNVYKRWNDELYYGGLFKFDYSAKLPGNNIEINPYFNFDFNCLTDKSNAFKLPVYEINPDFGFSFNVPITKINAIFTAQFDLNYIFIVGVKSKTPSIGGNFTNYNSDQIIPNSLFKILFLIPVIDVYVTPYIRIVYTRNDYYSYLLNINNLQSTNNNLLDLFVGVSINKNFIVRNVTHGFDLTAELEQRLLGATEYEREYRMKLNNYIYYPDGDTNYDGLLNEGDKHKKSNIFKEIDDSRTIYYNTKFLIDFKYSIDVNFLQTHHFKMRNYFFYRYNSLKEFKRYSIGDSPGSLDGWIGLVINLKYELPLFVFNTNKVVSKTMDRNYTWDFYWDFYIDLGLSATDGYKYVDDSRDYNAGNFFDKKKNGFAENSNIYYQENISTYTYKLGDYLFLYPAIAIGTSLRALPRFLPVEIKLDVGADIYQIIKLKSISGNSILIKFYINQKF